LRPQQLRVKMLISWGGGVVIFGFGWWWRGRG
jgi:hypothetical protein